MGRISTHVDTFKCRTTFPMQASKTAGDLVKKIPLFEKCQKLLDSAFCPRLPHEGILSPKYMQAAIPIDSTNRENVRKARQEALQPGQGVLPLMTDSNVTLCVLILIFP